MSARGGRSDVRPPRPPTPNAEDLQFQRDMRIALENSMKTFEAETRERAPSLTTRSMSTESLLPSNPPTPRLHRDNSTNNVDLMTFDTPEALERRSKADMIKQMVAGTSYKPPNGNNGPNVNWRTTDPFSISMPSRSSTTSMSSFRHSASSDRLSWHSTNEDFIGGPSTTVLPTSLSASNGIPSTLGPPAPKLQPPKVPPRPVFTPPEVLTSQNQVVSQPQQPGLAAVPRPKPINLHASFTQGSTSTTGNTTTTPVQDTKPSQPLIPPVLQEILKFVNPLPNLNIPYRTHARNASRGGTIDLIDLGLVQPDNREFSLGADDLRAMFDPLHILPLASVAAQQTPGLVSEGNSLSRAKTDTPERAPPLVLVNRCSNIVALPPVSAGQNVAAAVPNRSKIARQASMPQLNFSELKLIDVESSLDLQRRRLENLLTERKLEFENSRKWWDNVFVSRRVPLARNRAILPSSIKLKIVLPEAEFPLQLCCDIMSTVDQVVYEIMASISNEISADQYALKVFGLDEYLVPQTSLIHYQYVHQCLLFGNDVQLVLVRVSTLQHSSHDSGYYGNQDHIPQIDWSSEFTERISRDQVQILLDNLAGNVNRVLEAAQQGNILPASQVVQSVKAVCAHFARVEPSDLRDAVNSFTAAFDQLSEERKTVESIRRLREEKHLESENPVFRPSAENLNKLRRAVQSLATAVFRLVTIYCQSAALGFTLSRPEINTSTPTSNGPAGDIKEIFEVDFELLVQVESVHNLPNAWQEYDTFNLSCFVFYGTVELCPQHLVGPVSVQKSQQSFYPNLTFKDQWVQFNLPLCILPRESRLCFVLYGCKLVSNPDGQTPVGQMQASSLVQQQLGWTMMSLFDCERRLKQGSFLLAMSMSQTVEPWGPERISLSGIKESVLLLVTLPKIANAVVFPDVLPVDDESQRTQSFENLDERTQILLRDILETGSLGEELGEDEKEALWERRYALTRFPEALVMFLISAPGWDWAHLNKIYPLVEQWSELNGDHALELLLPKFPDEKVRALAVRTLQRMSADEVLNYLPQLVEALRFETWEDSNLAQLMYHFSLENRMFAHELFWELEEHCCYSKGGIFKRRCRLMQSALRWLCGRGLIGCVKAQKQLCGLVDHVARRLKEQVKDTQRQKLLLVELSQVDEKLSQNSVRLPVLPAMLCEGLDAQGSRYYNSFAKPMKLKFKTREKAYGVLYKDGDDLRQDSLVMQLVNLMDRVWLQEGLDLKMLTFKCLSTGHRKGFVEMIPDCRTFREIHQEQGGVTGPLKDEVLTQWLQKNNPDELEYKIALDNFRKSCAGWCVATYILGIGDRHNDNILLTRKGHMFHIDFGKYLGDMQMFGTIKRDRVPFVLTADMAHVINAGSSSTQHFQEFVDTCCTAFDHLRQHYALLVNILKLMVCSDIPGLNIAAVSYVHGNLWLDLSQNEATERFTKMIEESLGSRFPRWNNFLHLLAQMRGARYTETDGQLLSFMPNTYTAASDGRIEHVQVVNCVKRHTPEKHYLYHMQVIRQNEAVSTNIWRTYEEFLEFYLKVCMRFPSVVLPSLPRGSGTLGLGRTQVRDVAVRRKSAIESFLGVLFEMTDEIARCDLVYTFFHPMLRDQEESGRLAGDTQSNLISTTTSQSGASSGSHHQITGEIKVSIVYKDETLEILVNHARNLTPIDGNSPDSYVKCYLRPDPARASKLKTKIVRNSCNPTYNHRLTYRYPLRVVQSRELEVTIWQHGFLRENSFLGGVLIPLGPICARPGVQVTDWYPLRNVPR